MKEWGKEERKRQNGGKNDKVRKKGKERGGMRESEGKEEGRMREKERRNGERTIRKVGKEGKRKGKNVEE